MIEMAKKQTLPPPDENLKLLDGLIGKCYRQLETKFDKNAKIGDFIKMVEFRRKLIPGDADQRKFWSMLDDIRKESMGDEKKKPGRKKKKTKGRNAK